MMYFDLLVDDLLKQIISFLPIADIKSLFASRNRHVTPEELEQLAVQRRLPSAVCFDSLQVFESEYTASERIEHCIRVNDIRSFARIYTVDPAGIISKFLKYRIRPEITLLYLESKQELKQRDLSIAIRHKFEPWIIKCLQQGLLPRSEDYPRLSQAALYLLCSLDSILELILTLAADKGYANVIEKAIEKGAKGEGLMIRKYSSEILVLLSRIDCSTSVQDCKVSSITQLLLERKEGNFLLSVIQTRSECIFDTPLVSSLCFLLRQELIDFEFAYNLIEPRTIRLEAFFCVYYRPIEYKENAAREVSQAWKVRTALMNKEYDEVYAALKAGATGKTVSSIPDDIPDDLISLLTGVRSLTAQKELFQIATARSLYPTLCILLQRYGLDPILSSNKKVTILAGLSKAGAIPQEHYDLLL